MASVYQVEALVRQRPGISLDELREALGTDIHRPLKRLVVLGYIKRVVSIDQPISRSVIGLLGTWAAAEGPSSVRSSFSRSSGPVPPTPSAAAKRSDHLWLPSHIKSMS